ncbi:hypothetical protein GGF32_007953 [Allomyces javanicus]|nr:hypothetical protein GGF32_007953 [Allomyces javanicus]
MNAATLSTRWSACPLDKDAKRHVMVQLAPGPAVGAATSTSRGDDTRLLPALRIHVVDLTRGVWSETLDSDGLVKRRQTADLTVKRNLGALSFSWRFSVRLVPYTDAFHLLGNALLMPLLCLAQVYEHRLTHADDVIKRQEINIERLLALVPNPASYHGVLSTTSGATRSEPKNRAEDVESSFWSNFDRALRQLPRRPSSTQAPSSRPLSRQVDLELGHSQSSTQPPLLPPTSSSQAAPAGDAYTPYFASSTANSFSQALAGTARVTATSSRPAAPRPLAPMASSQLAAAPTSNSQVYGASSHSQTNDTSQFNGASSHSLFALFAIPTSDGPTAPPAQKPAELNLDLPSSPTTTAPPPLPHLPPLGSSASTGSRYPAGPELASDPATSVPAPPPPPASAPVPVKAGFYIPGVAKIGGSSSSSSSSAAPPTAPVGAMPPPPPLRPAPAAGTRKDAMQPPAGAHSKPAPAKPDSEPARKKQKRKALF